MAVNNEFITRIIAQCERFGLKHNIDLAASSEQLKLQVTHAMVELGLVTGISPGSGDFIGLVEHFTSGRFQYFR
jgi:hypothetical protein